MRKHVVWLLLLAACGPKVVFEQYQKEGLRDLLWGKDEFLTFRVPSQDSTKKYQMVLLLRHTSRIPYATLPIAMAAADPSGKPILVKKYDFVLRDPKSGRFVGEVMGDLGDTEQILEPEFEFKAKGDYLFTIVHALDNDDKAREIMEVGLHFREVKP